MSRWSTSALWLILFAAEPFLAQSSAPLKLDSIPAQMASHPEGLDDQGMTDLDTIVQAATLPEIQHVLPQLVDLTESSNEHLRKDSLLALWNISSKNLTDNPRIRDNTAAETEVPYLSRLAPRLMDSTPANRKLAFLLFASMTSIRPIPSALVQAAVAVLKSSQSTKLMPDSAGVPSSIGPQMLWILLPAGANFYLDPVSNVTVGRDSPEVQDAIIQFLRRADQTPESLAESMRALTLSQAQNPAVNAELLPRLNSPDVRVQELALRNIPGLALSTADFVAARARITSIATDPNTPTDLKQLAASILPKWSNERPGSAEPPPQPFSSQKR